MTAVLTARDPFVGVTGAVGHTLVNLNPALTTGTTCRKTGRRLTPSLERGPGMSAAPMEFYVRRGCS
jgi:hypothetical protein